MFDTKWNNFTNTSDTVSNTKWNCFWYKWNYFRTQVILYSNTSEIVSEYRWNCIRIQVKLFSNTNEYSFGKEKLFVYITVQIRRSLTWIMRVSDKLALLGTAAGLVGLGAYAAYSAGVSRKKKRERRGLAGLEAGSFAAINLAITKRSWGSLLMKTRPHLRIERLRDRLEAMTTANMKSIRTALIYIARPVPPLDFFEVRYRLDEYKK